MHTDISISMLGGWVNPHREQQTIPQGQTSLPPKYFSTPTVNGLYIYISIYIHLYFFSFLRHADAGADLTARELAAAAVQAEPTRWAGMDGREIAAKLGVSAVTLPSLSGDVSSVNRSTGHTHTPTENNTPDTDTHTRQEQHPKTPNEHLPQTLNNAQLQQSPFWVNPRSPRG